MITRRHFLSSCAVTAVTPCADAAAQVTDPFNITATAAAQSPIIPANRTTLWRPGVTYNTIPGASSPGIPTNRPTYKTLSPLGGGQDDTPQILAAMMVCPPGQAVQLTAGVFNIKTAIWFRPNNSGQITLRGVGPGQALSSGKGGTFVADPTATQLYCTCDPGSCFIVNGYNPVSNVTAYNLATDAVQGAYSVTLATDPGLTPGQIVKIDQNTNNDPDVFWGPNEDPPGGNSRQWFMRQDRSLAQLMEVASYNASTKTVTFTTPFHHNYVVTGLGGVNGGAAQLCVSNEKYLFAMGLEDFMIFDASTTARGNGSISMSGCAYSWIKHIESQWNGGPAIVMSGSFRCEIRDSYVHETSDPNPGGGGYMLAFSWGTSDSLMENNIVWYCNKVNVMQTTGGGNVVAYNYMTDSFGMNYPSLPEAGINAGHNGCSHMELLEGNYTHNFKGDSFWGASIDITVFRNWLTALRPGHPPLNSIVLSDGEPYLDDGTRVACDIQAGSYRQNIVGNVLGMNGQQLINYNKGGWRIVQNSFAYEQLGAVGNGTVVYMYYIGAQQTPNGWSFVPTMYQTILRQGNWDWVTKSQIWYANPIGASGATNTGTPQSIPNSLYLPAGNPPAFWGSNPWPWVDPSTGTTYTLPAKARFEAGTPNQL
jgi:hypothetical protein